MTGTYDFSDAKVIEELSPRMAPHWHVLMFCRSIGVRRKDGAPDLWMARYRTKLGGYRETKLGEIPKEGQGGLTYAEAFEKAQEWFRLPANAALASDPYERGSQADLIYCPWGSEFTVGHAMRDMVAWKRIAARKTTFETLISLINYYIMPMIGTLPVAQFKGHQVKRFMFDVLEMPPKRGNQKMGPRRPFSSLTDEEMRSRKGTVNTLVGILRMALKLAWENGETDDERCWRCIRRLPNRARSRLLHLDRSECAALLEVCRPDLRNLVLGGLYTGCRVTELEQMKVRDVADKVFGVYVEASKSSGPRFVFLPDEGLAFFLSITRGRPKEDHVFKHQDGTNWRGRHKHLFKNAVRDAQLPDGFVFHGLRHTYASQLIEAGTPLLVVAQQLGHATADTVARTYGHLAPQLREIQVRRNFASLDRSFIEDPQILSEVNNTNDRVQTGHWRDYGRIEQEGSWPKSNYVKGVGWGYKGEG